MGLLGVLKAGRSVCAAGPGVSGGGAGLRWMLEDSAPVALLTQGHLEGLYTGLSEDTAGGGFECFRWECGAASLEITNLECAAIGLTSEHLAYIIYTSSSTGTPKGGDRRMSTPGE